MIFRNLTLFRFPIALGDAFRHATADVDFDTCRLKPVGPLELSSRGFVPPLGRDSSELVRRSGTTYLLAVGGEDRLLPGTVVSDMLQKKLDEIEQKEGRKPGGRTRKRIRDEVIVDLLPRAFVKPSRIDVLVDLDLGLVAVDTSSRKAAENVVSEIRRALGSFPAVPLNAEVAPRSVLTGWLAGEPLPTALSLGDECELRDPIERGATVRCTQQELQGDEIATHLESGKQVARLALNLDDRVSLVLGDDLVIRKFRLLDAAVDSLQTNEREDLHAELDARLALMAGELKRVFAVLESALQLSKAEA